MKTRKGGWQSTKVGAGPVPIETSEGWLLIYHGVLTSCNGYAYSAGAALLDAPTGRIAIYYGGADTVTALAFAQADELIEYIKTHSDI